MKIIGIMACAQNGVVGQDGAIPWDHPDERKHFLNIIGTSPLIMGRKTFETMPKSVLQDRVSIIFSRTPSPRLPRELPPLRHPHERGDPGINDSPKGSIFFCSDPQRTISWDHLFLGPRARVDDGWVVARKDDGSVRIFMIGGAELANFLLEQQLISEFILTKLHRSYPGNAILNIKAFDNWKTSLINETPDYSIYKLWLI